MDDSLGLDLPEPLLSGPFTRPMAAAVGVARPALERMLASGVVRRVLRGVYVADHRRDDSGLRAEALGLVVAPGEVVVDRTAAWCHSLWPEPSAPSRLDVMGRRGSRHFGRRRPLRAQDVQSLGGVRVTTPLRTVADLGRLLAPERALGVLDAGLRSGLVDQRSLLVGLPRWSGLPGGHRLRGFAPLADGRARDLAESVARLRWLGAGLPTPVPGLAVHAGRGRVRVSLGLPRERFAVCVGSEGGEGSTAQLAQAGWRALVLSPARVLGSDAELLQCHLVQRFHTHLLGAAG